MSADVPQGDNIARSNHSTDLENGSVLLHARRWYRKETDENDPRALVTCVRMLNGILMRPWSWRPLKVLERVATSYFLRSVLYDDLDRITPEGVRAQWNADDCEVVTGILLTFIRSSFLLRTNERDAYLFLARALISIGRNKATSTEKSPHTAVFLYLHQLTLEREKRGTGTVLCADIFEGLSPMEILSRAAYLAKHTPNPDMRAKCYREIAKAYAAFSPVHSSVPDFMSAADAVPQQSTASKHENAWLRKQLNL